MIAIALGGVFLDAYDLTSLAYGIKDIARQFALSPVQVGFVSSAITFGAILSALFGGYLTGRIGRYRVFMADMLFFVVAAVAAGLAPNAWVLGGARFLTSLLVWLAIRWEPSGYDIDAEDYENPLAAAGDTARA